MQHVSPAGRLTRMGALRIVDPKAWARDVKAALRDADGSINPAAESLGVSRRTLLYWLAEEKDGLLKGVQTAPPGRKPASD